MTVDTVFGMQVNDSEQGVLPSCRVGKGSMPKPCRDGARAASHPAPAFPPCGGFTNGAPTAAQRRGVKRLVTPFQSLVVLCSIVICALAVPLKLRNKNAASRASIRINFGSAITLQKHRSTISGIRLLPKERPPPPGVGGWGGGSGVRGQKTVCVPKIGLKFPASNFRHFLPKDNISCGGGGVGGGWPGPQTTPP